MKRERAIEILRKAYSPDGSDETLRNALETLIPELSESEDERIRKALVWHLKADVDFVSNGVTKAECLAYLEKQKEQRIKRLNELRPQWKPSEEQIHATIEALKYLPNNKDEWRILNTLVDVFKKLM